MVNYRSNYLVIRTTGDGAMTLYSAGVYLDKLVRMAMMLNSKSAS